MGFVDWVGLVGLGGLFDLLEFVVLLVVPVGLVPEWGRMPVRGMECMLEGDRSSKQAALETGHQVDERVLEMSVYMKHEKGKNCY
jgi:hypothetical protein